MSRNTDRDFYTYATELLDRPLEPRDAEIAAFFTVLNTASAQNMDAAIDFFLNEKSPDKKKEIQAAIIMGIETRGFDRRNWESVHDFARRAAERGDRELNHVVTEGANALARRLAPVDFVLFYRYGANIDSGYSLRSMIEPDQIGYVAEWLAENQDSLNGCSHFFTDLAEHAQSVPSHIAAFSKQALNRVFGKLTPDTQNDSPISDAESFVRLYEIFGQRDWADLGLHPQQLRGVASVLEKKADEPSAGDSSELLLRLMLAADSYGGESLVTSFPMSQIIQPVSGEVTKRRTETGFLTPLLQRLAQANSRCFRAAAATGVGLAATRMVEEGEFWNLANLTEAVDDIRTRPRIYQSALAEVFEAIASSPFTRESFLRYVVSGPEKDRTHRMVDFAQECISRKPQRGKNPATAESASKTPAGPGG